MSQAATRTPKSAEVATVESQDGVSLIALNRPESLNSFNAALFAAVHEALEAAAADPSIGCVVLTGSGRAFTAGSDISEPPQPDAPNPYDAFISCVETFPKPLVAAVNGLAVGIGTTMLGHCDIVLAGESARFRMPFAALGLVPEAGSTVTMPALMGRQNASLALLTGNWISSAEAAETGLVLRVAEDDRLLTEALDLAKAIAQHPLESLVETKRLLLAARLPHARDAREREEREFRRLLSGPAHAEALAAFREKRPPNFRDLAS